MIKTLHLCLKKILWLEFQNLSHKSQFLCLSRRCAQPNLRNNMTKNCVYVKREKKLRLHASLRTCHIKVNWMGFCALLGILFSPLFSLFIHLFFSAKIKKSVSDMLWEWLKNVTEELTLFYISYITIWLIINTISILLLRFKCFSPLPISRSVIF